MCDGASTGLCKNREVLIEGRICQPLMCVHQNIEYKNTVLLVLTIDGSSGAITWSDSVWKAEYAVRKSKPRHCDVKSRNGCITGETGCGSSSHNNTDCQIMMI